MKRIKFEILRDGNEYKVIYLSADCDAVCIGKKSDIPIMKREIKAYVKRIRDKASPAQGQQ